MHLVSSALLLGARLSAYLAFLWPCSSAHFQRQLCALWARLSQAMAFEGHAAAAGHHADTMVIALVTQRPGPGQLQPHRRQLPSTAETGAGVMPASPKVLVWPGRSSSRARAAKAPAGTGLLLAAAASGEGGNGSDSSHRGCCRSE